MTEKTTMIPEIMPPTNVKDDDATNAQALKTIDINSLIRTDENRVFTTSLHVAKAFGKRHDNILRDIANLECSEEFRQLNFEETPYIHEQNGQAYPSFNLTRDGFSILVMGFTGKKAMAWKEKFLKAFNAMEAALIQGHRKLELPPDEEGEICRQRHVKVVKAASAIWAHIDNISLSVADSALCAYLEIPSLDQAQIGDGSRAYSFMLSIIQSTCTDKSQEQPTPRQVEIFERISVGCEQLRMFRGSKVTLEQGDAPTSAALERMTHFVMSKFFWRYGYSGAAINFES